MLIKTNKIHITCDESTLFGHCNYEWLGTEEEYKKILEYDGESLNHFPSRNQHNEYICLKEGKCPVCVAREKELKLPKRPMVRGGVIPTPPKYPKWKG